MGLKSYGRLSWDRISWHINFGKKTTDSFKVKEISLASEVPSGSCKKPYADTRTPNGTVIRLVGGYLNSPQTAYGDIAGLT
jgi:hypothetical protein